MKGALALESDDPGLDHSALSEFRDRIAQGDRVDRVDRVDRLLGLVIECLVAAGLVKQGGDGSAPTSPTCWPRCGG